MKKSFFRVGFAAATLLLLAVMGGGCSLELNNEDERAALYDTAGLMKTYGYDAKILKNNLEKIELKENQINSMVFGISNINTSKYNT